MEGRIRAFPNIWKAKDQGIHYPMAKHPNIFCFLAQKLTCVGSNGGRCVYMSCRTSDLHMSSKIYV